MTNWLRIIDGTVCNVEVHDAEPAAADGVTWAQDTTAGIGWSYDGKTFTPPAAPAPVVPVSVSGLQAKLELNNRGLYAATTAAVTAAAATNAAMLIFWNFAPTWERADTNVAAIATALNLTPAQIDAMFIEAAKL